MVHVPSDSQKFEIEAHLRLEQVRHICDALLGGQWMSEPHVVRHIGLLAEQAARFLEVAAWPTDRIEDEAA
jgi:hypothetical protein